MSSWADRSNLGTILKAQTGETVTYTRQGMTPLTTLVASKFHLSVEVEDERGFYVQVDVWRFGILQADLVLDGQVREPRAGDRITAQIDGKSAELECVRIPPLPAFKSPGSDGTRWYVYTKRVS